LLKIRRKHEDFESRHVDNREETGKKLHRWVPTELICESKNLTAKEKGANAWERRIQLIIDKSPSLWGGAGP